MTQGKRNDITADYAYKYGKRRPTNKSGTTFGTGQYVKSGGGQKRLSLYTARNLAWQEWLSDRLSPTHHHNMTETSSSHYEEIQILPQQ